MVNSGDETKWVMVEAEKAGKQDPGLGVSFSKSWTAGGVGCDS